MTFQAATARESAALAEAHVKAGCPKKRREIFVFGSNLAGVHGAGAALAARKHYGAVNGVGVGLTGNAYALPTKDERLTPLPDKRVYAYIKEFMAFAREHEHWTFRVTRVGCGLAGFTDKQIAPLFDDAPMNCHFDSAWRPWLEDGCYTFWGTFEPKKRLVPVRGQRFPESPMTPVADLEEAALWD
jgi:hypothetical protein